MSKKIKNALRTALLILVSLVLGVNLYLWNAQSLSGNALPMPFGYGAAVVLSGSMEPTIMTNDLILVKAQESYGVDDIVVYQSGSVLVVHRIVETDGETVVTRGDANNAADEPIRAETIKGRVLGHVSGVGAAVRLIKTPAVSVALLVCAVLLVELPYLNRKKKDSEELEKIKAEIRKLREEQSSREEEK